MKIIVFEAERELTDGQLLRLVDIGLLNLTAVRRAERNRFPRKDEELLMLLRDLHTDFAMRPLGQLAIPDGTGRTK